MNKNLYWPGGNPTLLIEDISGDIKSDEFSSIASQYLSESVEQVGFTRYVKDKNLRLEMMGGEFCVNAVRSLALWNYINNGKTKSLIECSGSSDVFRCEVENWVSIKVPKKYTTKRINKNCFLVKLDGIAHFVFKDLLKEEDINKELIRLMKDYSKEIEPFPAIGLIALDGNLIKPLVYVRATDSMIFETACGSGAIAAFIVNNKQIACYIQPSDAPMIVREEKSCFVLKGEVKDISKYLKV